MRKIKGKSPKRGEGVRFLWKNGKDLKRK